MLRPSVIALGISLGPSLCLRPRGISVLPQKVPGTQQVWAVKAMFAAKCGKSDSVSKVTFLLVVQGVDGIVPYVPSCCAQIPSS